MDRDTQHAGTEMINMGDGGGGDTGIGGDWGSLTGPNVAPADGNCVVVDSPGNEGILSGPDGSGYVVLPRQPARPEQDVADEPAGPGDSTA